MCGIFSLMNVTLSKEQLKMLYKAFMMGKGRGPEHSILEKVHLPHTYFGFHRLAINGLNDTSNQPIYYNGITLICNGEIYNYKELIDELDIEMTTQSDCEIIIHLYLRYGFEKMIQMIDGVFAFNLLDLRQEIALLYVARDAFGVRPLFEFEENGINNSFGFSSEIKMICNIEKKSDDNSYNITPFEPGTWKLFKYCSEHNWQLDSYDKWHTLSNIEYINNITDARDKIRTSLINAVKKRILTY